MKDKNKKINQLSVEELKKKIDLLKTMNQEFSNYYLILKLRYEYLKKRKGV